MEGIAERPDGSRVPFIPYPTPVRDQAGNVIGTVNVLLDITKRKLAESACQESEEHLRHMVALNPQVLWIADACGDIVEISPRWSTWTGMTRQQALGQGWAAASHADDLPRFRRATARSTTPGSGRAGRPPSEVTVPPSLCVELVFSERGLMSARHGRP